MKLIDRLLTYLDNKGISDYKFEKIIKVSNGYLNKTKQGVRGIGSDILEKILRQYPDLNLIWLITGQGNMLLNPSNNHSTNDGINSVFPDDEMKEERALLQVLLLEVAKIRAKLYGVSVEDAIDELQQNTKLALGLKK